MKVQEGPLFGALIIGVGVAYLVWRKTQNTVYALGAGLAVAIADYVILIWIKSFTKK